ncbi:hypothetical protein [uncultured Clostridium sp.]|uniref:hypothetical protein n=1 Tax=uncultured Clostridium sp. TaxID=59620 RepID=UPI0025971339|nr:hypothetical protein [uncultured Clostridium sp.]
MMNLEKLSREELIELVKIKSEMLELKEKEISDLKLQNKYYQKRSELAQETIANIIQIGKKFETDKVELYTNTYSK